PALHGGVIGAFMEMTALAQLSVVQHTPKVHKTIDVTIEYLRPGRALTTYARADLRKVGRRIANVTVEAWQEARGTPVAALRGHFMLSGED
ncbi:MAG: PaaI family thioesterase, partial [Phenylobacterium sp.]|nr:PaaI family thioesterase [Phenylobacterium sp.]